ncbi:adenylylsulfate kinase [Cupriavidus gilardii CR3]|uniref:adenylyl-sulfate kinase n=1 Tax=Cupriavidus gilardii TaxID=82541 RepID=UPI0006CB2442|nr:adenylyl-sulfate kinase [Cupriavidus gilardii]ALD89770.1 adenylylsulfate kinase [Cupriavidus gilardii CR3]MCT9015935.1 adenylyl-sulfate kinase [Cupriavidus gilardii]MCT9055705.1 adenylyl-sulfate kinase [Cupriavidus gilardii]MCT9070976.1 adenylyl-sulfate kinase [Cupriavidus gilardii]MCT9125307.1 adenylyl-sulfate kinase [Cupriavidus gilardii]
MTKEARPSPDVKAVDAPPPTRSYPITLWLTGLSGAGKTTLARNLQRWLYDRGITALRVDGDELRAGLTSDLGFSAEERHANVRRAAHMAKLLNDQGVLVLASLISPAARDREAAREIVGADRFAEVYVHADLERCRQRDPKGLYRKVASGDIAQFTGISAPYEPPVAPDLTVDTTTTKVEECVEVLAAFLDGRLSR